MTVTISNIGTAATPPLVLTVGGTNPGDFVRQSAGDTCTGQAIAPGSCSVQYRFTPAARGLRQATLTVTAGSLTPASSLFQGLGQAPAALSFASMSLSFGTGVIGTNTTTASIQLNNTGDVATGAPTFATSPMAEFSVSSNNCGASISPLSGCSVTLTFVPAASGARTGTLQASASPGGSSQIVMLDGVGATAGSLSVTPNPGVFGPILLGSSSAPQTFTVSNSGGVAVNNLTVSVGGTNQSSFTAVNQCGSTLAAMTSCTVRVTFTPQARGALSAFLQAVATGSTAQATLQGTGQQQATLVPRANLGFGTVIVGQSAQLAFTLDNTGDVASGAPSFTSTDTTNFTVLAGTCNVAVPAGMSCSGNVRYSPSAGGSHSSTVGIVATPGGGQSFTASGLAQTPAALTLAPASGSSVNYGNVLVSTPVTQRFVVTNTGTQPTGPLSLTMSGTNGSLWQISSGTGDCQQNQPLAGSMSCTIDVRFLSSTNGMKSGVLTASATPGTSPSLTLTANAQNPANLTVVDTTKDFGGAEVNAGSMSLYTWRITNSGDATSGALTFSNTNPSEFTIQGNTCTGATLTGGSSCTVDVLFNPTAGGNRTGTLTIGGTPGGSVMLAMTGKGQYRLTIIAQGGGGFVSTTDNRLLNCGATGCSALYDPASPVTVQATNVGTSGRHFASWSSPANCATFGLGRNCSVTMNGPITATANFILNQDNLIFVSSVDYPSTLGAPPNYDAKCNQLAVDAGLTTANNTFVSWLSIDTNSAASRLGSGFGAFRRVDGTLFATSETNLLAGALLSTPMIDEFGKATSQGVWTGTLTDGAANTAADCADWTNNTATTDFGLSYRGPVAWTVGSPGAPCTGVARIYCLQRISTATASNPPIPTGGKIAYVTQTGVIPGGGLSALDAHCAANKPPAYSSRTFVAFAATSTQSAQSRITLSSNYYRLDGMFIGSGVDMGSDNGGPWNGVWQSNTGAYPSSLLNSWTGAIRGSQLASTSQNCNDWASTTGSGVVGTVAGVGIGFFLGSGASCNTPQRVYCIEP